NLYSLLPSTNKELFCVNQLALPSPFHSPNPAAETSPPLPRTKSKSFKHQGCHRKQDGLHTYLKSPSMKTNCSDPQELFAVQCGECSKWRLIPTEDEYKEIRSKSIEETFECSKKPNLTCKDAADIKYDCSRTSQKHQLDSRENLCSERISPTGKKLRSGTEVARFLDGNPNIQGVHLKDFSFAVPKIIDETVPKDVERKVSTKAERRAKKSFSL
ncbi:hypothetical protein V2J09_008190, partial [Rumex salicifolius]